MPDIQVMPGTQISFAKIQIKSAKFTLDINR